MHLHFSLRRSQNNVRRSLIQAFTVSTASWEDLIFVIIEGDSISISLNMSRYRKCYIVPVVVSSLVLRGSISIVLNLCTLLILRQNKLICAKTLRNNEEYIV